MRHFLLTALRAPDTGPQVAERRDQGPSLLSELCQKHNSLLASALYPAHYTLYSTIDNIGSELLPDMRDGKIKIAPLYSPSASAMIISGQCSVGGREARNVIKFYSRIIFIQIRVQSLMLALHCPEAHPATNIFSFKLSKTLLFVLILIWQLLKKICF